MQALLPKIILCVSLFFLIFISIKFLYASAKRKFLKKCIDRLNLRFNNRLKERDAYEEVQGKTEKNRFIDKIDNLVEESGIRRFINFFTSELFIVFTIIFTLIFTAIIYFAFHFWVLTVFTFIVSLFIPHIILTLMKKHNNDVIDKQSLVFINTLINLCGSNDDIVAIFQKSIPYLKYPLNAYTQRFVFESKKGISLRMAFKHFEDKIHTEHLKNLLINLYICSQNAANYKDILQKTRVLIKPYIELEVSKRGKIGQGLIDIMLILAVGTLTLKIVSDMIPNFYQTMRYSTFGNLMLLYMLLVLFFGFVKIFLLSYSD